MSYVYPSFLPNPQVEYSFQNSGGVVTSQFDSGRVNQRKRFTTQRSLVNASFKFDYFQLAAFEGFVNSTLSNGASAFDISLPDPTNQTSSVQNVIIVGGNYDVDAIAGEALWSVSCQLLVQEKIVYDGATILILDIYDGNISDAVTFSNEFHESIHDDLSSAIIG